VTQFNKINEINVYKWRKLGLVSNTFPKLGRVHYGMDPIGLRSGRVRTQDPCGNRRLWPISIKQLTNVTRAQSLVPSVCIPVQCCTGVYGTGTHHFKLNISLSIALQHVLIEQINKEKGEMPRILTIPHSFNTQRITLLVYFIQ